MTGPTVPDGDFRLPSSSKMDMTSTTSSSTSAAPSAATAAVLVQSAPVPSDAVSVQGPNFENPMGLQEFLGSYERIGFQATSFGRAIRIVENMVSLNETLFQKQRESLNKRSVFISENGAFQTNPSPPTSHPSTWTPPSAVRRNARSSSDTPPTSSRPACARPSSTS